MHVFVHGRRLFDALSNTHSTPDVAETSKIVMPIYANSHYLSSPLRVVHTKQNSIALSGLLGLVRFYFVLPRQDFLWKNVLG
jgi:hypothetical protein